MVNLNMLSNNFSHSYGSTWYKKPQKVTWDFNSYKNSISVYIDRDMYKGFNDIKDGKKKFLWLLESRWYDGGITNNIKLQIEKVKETYEQVWTHNAELLELDPIFKWCPGMGSWIESPKIYEKNKSISMITTSKQETEQHKFRYNFAIQNKNILDLFGRGFREIEKKEKALNEYMFSVAIENDTYDTYFTEKILDCFLTGTIPIYKGTRNISNHFDSNGIIFLDEISNLNDILINIHEIYHSKKEAINKNFENAIQFDILDDWLYDNYIYKYF